MDNLHRIKKTSQALGLVSALFTWLVPIACAAYWLAFNRLPEPMKVQAGLTLLDTEMAPLTRALCFVATMLPAGVAMRGFSLLRRLFGLYAAGEIFSPANVACYRQLGRTLLYWAGAVFLYTPLISLAASAGMPPGQRRLTLAIGSIELVVVFAGAAAMVISWVMDEGRRIEEDQSLTI